MENYRIIYIAKYDGFPIIASDVPQIENSIGTYRKFDSCRPEMKSKNSVPVDNGDSDSGSPAIIWRVRGLKDGDVHPVYSA